MTDKEKLEKCRTALMAVLVGKSLITEYEQNGVKITNNMSPLVYVAMVYQEVFGAAGLASAEPGEKK